MKEPSESLKLRVKENQIKIKKIDMNLEEITKITGGPVITENKISKQGQRIILDVELPLRQRVKIINPIYIPKLNETFIVEFSKFIDNKEIAEKLEDMDDNEQFRVTDYYSVYYKDHVEDDVLYKDYVIIYITIGLEDE